MSLGRASLELKSSLAGTRVFLLDDWRRVGGYGGIAGERMLGDSDIVKRVLDGEIDLFEQLVERYQGRVFGIVSKRIPADDWGEVAQDVFLNCFRSLSGFDTARPFENWIATIAVRRCHDYWRSRSRRGVLEVEARGELLEVAGAAESVAEFEARVKKSDMLALLDEAMGKLNPDERELMDMIYLEEMKLKDVAEALGLSLSNVKVKAMRTRGKLRAAFESILAGESE